VKKVLRVNQILCKPEHSKKDLEQAIRKALKISDKTVIDYEIVKKSIDSRKKPDIFYVYNINIHNKPKDFNIHKAKNAAFTEDITYTFPHRAMHAVKQEERPVIIGFGPAGMFAALKLAEAGFRPIVFERGECVTERKKTVQHFWDTEMLDEESNVQFGEGGAGTFSDGKLNTAIKDASGRIKEILKTFVLFGAPEEILYLNKPHIGTDILENVVMGIRKHIISLGGEIYFNSKLLSLKTEGSVLKEICIKDTKSGKMQEHFCSSLCLAIGHSARDTLKMLKRCGCEMMPKAFAVGVRIEHPQQLINENAYGSCAYKLPAADYKLTYQTKSKRGVYSFCMCPGGYVVNASSEKGAVAVNGMSYSDRGSTNANSALIVTVTPNDYGYGIFDGILLQQQMEKLAYRYGKGKIPIQLLGDFRENRMSTGTGIVRPCMKGRYTMADLNVILPSYVSDSLKEAISAFDKKIKGFAMEEAVLSGVESRTSSPVRLLRSEQGCASIKGVYPCGEGAGYAGGIISAAVDGIKVAEKIAQFTRI